MELLSKGEGTSKPEISVEADTGGLLIVIFMAIIGFAIYSVGSIAGGIYWYVLLVLIGLAVFGLSVLATFGWVLNSHAKWYVKTFVWICFPWEGFWIYAAFLASGVDPLEVIPTLIVSLFPPLILLWYVEYRNVKRVRVRKLKNWKEAVESKLEEELEKLKYLMVLDGITEVEFEQKKEKLLELLEVLKQQLGRGVITQEEYEQKKKELVGIV